MVVHSNTKTLDYYNKNASAFISNTVDVVFSKTQDYFLEKLYSDAYILDFGCGSGRDAKYFVEHGYKVDAMDGSEELCRYATSYAGIEVKHMLFQELDVEEIYDGIWACSSILHLSRSELEVVIPKMIRALKQQGIIYTSFKYGTYEGERGGRYFTDFTIEDFTEFIRPFGEIYIEEDWLTNDVRSGRGEEKWLNLILRKR